MKKFSFSLDTVLNFKEQTLDIKNHEMAKLQMELKELEQKINDFDNQFAETNQKMVLELQTGLSPTSMAAYKTYLEAINLRTKKLIHERFNRLNFIQQKLVVIVALKSDIAGLENLKEKQWSEYFRLNQKEQELSLEEFVSQARYYAV